jgi:hypothetical protein
MRRASILATNSFSKQAHFYQNRVLEHYASTQPSLVSLRQLVVFGRQLSPTRILTSANHVRTELPVRIAHRIRELQQLPYVAVTNPRIALSYDLYWEAFEVLRKVKEIKTLEDNDEFCKILNRLLKDHVVVLPQLVAGVRECKDYIEDAERFLMEALRSRVSRRVLAEQHVALTEQLKGKIPSTRIGLVDTRCRARDLLHNIMKSNSVVVKGQLDCEFVSIPKHAELAIGQAIANATQRTDQAEVTVAEGASDVVFRVSDKAGGVAEEELGQKLLLARVYTEYWGGAVRWMSLPGWGTDVYLQICKRGTRFENIH